MSVNASEVFPLTVTIPASFEQTSMIDVIDSYASVQATYVERGSIYEVSDTWRNACGFYILFSPISGDGSYNVYVGKSDKDFTKRLRSHDQNKEGWVTALLVQRVSMEGLSSTQSSFLEGALRDLFDRAAHVTCHNIARTGDWTLPDHEKLLMKQVIESTLRIMHLRGYSTMAPTNVSKANESMTIDASTSEASVVVTTPKLTSPPIPNITMSVPSPAKPNTTVAPSIAKESLPPASLIAAPPNSSISPESESVEVSTIQKKSSIFSLFRKSSSVEPLNEPTRPHDPEKVFQALRAWRIQKAREQGLSPGYVFDDYVLRALAEKMPADFEDLLTISGIKEVKRAKYGNDILQVLSKYRKE